MTKRQLIFGNIILTSILGLLYVIFDIELIGIIFLLSMVPALLYSIAAIFYVFVIRPIKKLFKRK